MSSNKRLNTTQKYTRKIEEYKESQIDNDKILKIMQINNLDQTSAAFDNLTQNLADELGDKEFEKLSLKKESIKNQLYDIENGTNSQLNFSMTSNQNWPEHQRHRTSSLIIPANSNQTTAKKGIIQIEEVKEVPDEDLYNLQNSLVTYHENSEHIIPQDLFYENGEKVEVEENIEFQSDDPTEDQILIAHQRLNEIQGLSNSIIEQTSQSLHKIDSIIVSPQSEKSLTFDQVVIQEENTITATDDSQLRIHKKKRSGSERNLSKLSSSGLPRAPSG